MEIDAFLCDHAQAADGKLFVSGGGIDRSFVGPDVPHMVNLAIAAVVHVPYTATNAVHRFSVALVDDDGHPISPFTPDGSAPPLAVEIPFNLGRPPGLPAGQSQAWSVAFNFQFGLSALGQYHFALSIDGTDVKRLPLLVGLPPQGPGITFPGGPATPGRIG